MQTTNTQSPDSVLDLLRTSVLRLGLPLCAERLWERHLSAKDKERLGCRDAKDAWHTFGTVEMWSKARGVSLDRAVCEAAHRLNLLTQSDFEWLMREIGECLDARESMCVAIRRGELVLCERPREVYWQGELIEFDWETNPVLWNYIWVLSKHGKRKLRIDMRSFDAIGDSLKNWKYRLGKDLNFPVELLEKITPDSPGGQRLNLPAHEIRIFESLPGGEFREWAA